MTLHNPRNLSYNCEVSGCFSRIGQTYENLPASAAEAVHQDGVAEGPLLPVVLHHIRHQVHHRLQAEVEN